MTFYFQIKRFFFSIRVFLIALSILIAPLTPNIENSPNTSISLSTETHAADMIGNMMSIITMIGMGYVVAKLALTCLPRTTDMYFAIAGMAIFMAGQILKIATYKEDNKETENLNETDNVQLDSLKKQKKSKEDNASVGQMGGMLDTAAAVALGTAAGIAYMQHTAGIAAFQAVLDALQLYEGAVLSCHAKCLMMVEHHKIMESVYLGNIAELEALNANLTGQCETALTTCETLAAEGIPICIEGVMTGMKAAFDAAIAEMKVAAPALGNMTSISAAATNCSFISAAILPAIANNFMPCLNFHTASIESGEAACTEAYAKFGALFTLGMTSNNKALELFETVPTSPSILHRSAILTQTLLNTTNITGPTCNGVLSAIDATIQIPAACIQAPSHGFVSFRDDLAYNDEPSTFRECSPIVTVPCEGVSTAGTTTHSVIQECTSQCTDLFADNSDQNTPNYFGLSLKAKKFLTENGFRFFQTKFNKDDSYNDIYSYLQFHEMSRLLNFETSSISLKEYQHFIKNYASTNNKDNKFGEVFSFAKKYSIDLIVPESHAFLDQIFSLAPGIIQVALGIAGFQAFQMDKWVSVPLGRAIGFGGMAAQAGVSAAANFMEAGKQEEQAGKIDEIIQEFEKNKDEITTDDNSLTQTYTTDTSKDDISNIKDVVIPEKDPESSTSTSIKSTETSTSSTLTSTSGQNQNSLNQNVQDTVKLPSEQMPLCPNPPCQSQDINKKMNDLMKMAIPNSNSRFTDSSTGQAANILSKEVLSGGNLSGSIGKETLAKLKDLHPKVKEDLEKFKKMLNKNQSDEKKINFNEKENEFLGSMEEGVLKATKDHPEEVKALVSKFSNGQNVDLASYRPRSFKVNPAKFAALKFSKTNLSAPSINKPKVNPFEFFGKGKIVVKDKDTTKKASDPMDPNQILEFEEINIFESITKRYLKKYDVLLY